MTWGDQPLFTGDGLPLTYTVREVDASGNAWSHPEYLSAVNGLTVTNTYHAPLTEIHARKIWSGGMESDHVAPTLNLYRNGRLYASTPTVTPSTQTAPEFQYVWSNLPTTDAFGQAYYYAVAEAGLAAGYVSSPVTGSGTEADPFSITNQYTDTVIISFTAFKQWIGGEAAGARPEIELQLYRSAGGKSAQAVSLPGENPVVLPSGTVEHTWNDLPARDAQQRLYTYSIQELRVGSDTVLNSTAGSYEITHHSRYVTNTYVSPTSAVYARVLWDGGEDADHVTPPLMLLRNGVRMDDASLANVQ